MPISGAQLGQRGDLVVGGFQQLTPALDAWSLPEGVGLDPQITKFNGRYPEQTLRVSGKESEPDHLMRLMCDKDIRTSVRAREQQAITGPDDIHAAVGQNRRFADVDGTSPRVHCCDSLGR